MCVCVLLCVYNSHTVDVKLQRGDGEYNLFNIFYLTIYYALFMCLYHQLRLSNHNASKEVSLQKQFNLIALISLPFRTYILMIPVSLFTPFKNCLAVTLLFYSSKRGPNQNGEKQGAVFQLGEYFLVFSLSATIVSYHLTDLLIGYHNMNSKNVISTWWFKPKSRHAIYLSCIL